MTDALRVYSVLVVSDSEHFPKFISGLLPETSFSPVHYARSNTHARQMLAKREYDFVLIDAPLPDDVGTRLAIDISTDSSQIALMIVRSELYSSIYEKTVRHGVLIIRKPVSQQLLMISLDYMCAMKERLRKMQKKTLNVEDKIQEIRLVNRAKWLLISENDMTETEAHRWIEKQAMNACVTRKEIAQRVIDRNGVIESSESSKA